MSSANILITGCHGLTGSKLAEKLNGNKLYNVTGIGRGDKGIFKTIVINLGDDWNEKSLPANIDVVVHLAQSVNFRDFPGSAAEIFNVNTNSTLKLLEYARKAGAKKFIYASSGGLYGTSNNAFTETSPLLFGKDLGFYLATKICSENLAENYRTFFEVNIIRPFFMYGPAQRKDMLIPRLVESVKNGTTIKLQGAEGIKINPIYVDDAVNAIEKLISHKGSDTFNIAGNEVLSIKDIATAIGKRFNATPFFEHDSTTSPKDIVADNKKMKQFLSEPTVSFSEALKSFT